MALTQQDKSLHTTKAVSAPTLLFYAHILWLLFKKEKVGHLLYIVSLYLNG